jgi:mono/diheme cytochrome c family protein
MTISTHRVNNRVRSIPIGTRTNQPFRSTAFAVLTMAAVALCRGLQPVAETPQELDMDTYLQGRQIFESQCAPCHGRTGRGDGEWAEGVTTKPRNFRKGIFKYRSTPMGFLPTTEDLMRTIRNGVSGTMMPTFNKLPDEDMRAVIAYVRGFSRKWDRAENFTAPIPPPPVPDWFHDTEKRAPHAASGAVTFQQFCFVCHGTSAKGNGPGSKGLIDVWENPITPADLTQAHHHSGDSPTDLYRTISLGLDGTPMVGFRQLLKPEQIWDLIAFIHSVQKD